VPGRAAEGPDSAMPAPFKMELELECASLASLSPPRAGPVGRLGEQRLRKWPPPRPTAQRHSKPEPAHTKLDATVSAGMTSPGMAAIARRPLRLRFYAARGKLGPRKAGSDPRATRRTRPKRRGEGAGAEGESNPSAGCAGGMPCRDRRGCLAQNRCPAPGPGD
jgi:hypothetical protein